MKRFCFFFYFIFQAAIASCQQSFPTPSSGIGLSFFLNDYQSQGIFKRAKAEVHSRLLDFSRMSPGIGIRFQKRFSSSFSYSLSFQGSFTDSAVAKHSRELHKRLLLETDASLLFHWFAAEHRVQPFLKVGVGISSYAGHYSLGLPAGLGMQVKMLKDVSAYTDIAYKKELSHQLLGHFCYHLGILSSFGKSRVAKKKASVPTAIMLAATSVDSDKDGITDNMDHCPTIPGLAAFAGCPDSDGDGIADHDDHCPHVFGVAGHSGCPVPDADKDGLADDKDGCPLQPGTAKYHGCPAADLDRDGTADDADDCPSLAGTASLKGCPLFSDSIVSTIGRLSKEIYFKTASYTIDERSWPALQQIAAILQSNPHWHVSIEGHTDNRGDDDYNKIISRRRAGAILDYLEQCGVSADRMRSTGYGEDKPLEDNHTAQGRAVNRRVEIILSNDR